MQQAARPRVVGVPCRGASCLFTLSLLLASRYATTGVSAPGSAESNCLLMILTTAGPRHHHQQQARNESLWMFRLRCVFLGFRRQSTSPLSSFVASWPTRRGLVTLEFHPKRKINTKAAGLRLQGHHHHSHQPRSRTWTFKRFSTCFALQPTTSKSLFRTNSALLLSHPSRRLGSASHPLCTCYHAWESTLKRPLQGSNRPTWSPSTWRWSTRSGSSLLGKTACGYVRSVGSGANREREGSDVSIKLCPAGFV